jgi:hypothetical protein
MTWDLIFICAGLLSLMCLAIATYGDGVDHDRVE